MVVITSMCKSDRENFYRAKMPAENPTNAITDPTIPRLIIRNPIDRPYSLLNLANSALSKPPPTLTIRANIRRDKNNTGTGIKRL
ncbi:MAG TPA: hypothetical protein VKA98_08120 [Nitrososphaeraceae archaeon]|nr:hypothetical protein [Nitrososphaeraceae archaeon]